MSKFWLPLCCAMLLACVAVTGVHAQAAPVGQAELRLLEAIFTGNIGLTLGLFIAIGGIITFVQGKTGAGITLIVLGVLITLLPGVFNGMRAVMCPIAGALGGSCGEG